MSQPPNKYPPFEYIVASLDSAFTVKEQNDPSALTIWGVFRLKDDTTLAGAEPDKFGHVWHGDAEGKLRIMLVHAWRKHLPFSGLRIEREPKETGLAYKQRTQHTWGLVEWVSDTNFL